MKELTKSFAQLIVALILMIGFAISTTAFSHWASSDTVSVPEAVSTSEAAQH